MRVSPALVAALMLAPLLAVPAAGNFHETLGEVPDREFVLVMSGTSFNGLRAPHAPLLEAVVGETVKFTVLVPAFAEAHTFHMHGHPWFLPTEKKMVDTFLLRPGDVHAFTVRAGGPDGHAGDWMYHCHMDAHMAAGMWGIFRVHPFAVGVTPLGGALDVRLDRLGTPLADATLDVTLDGAPVDATVTELGDGRYRVDAPALAGATGKLVVVAKHPAWGESVARVPLA